MFVDWNLRYSSRKKLGENLIALPDNGKILFSNSAFIVRGKRQSHLAKANIDIRVMVALLSFPGDPAYESDAF
jgi:hypothetical protein